MISSIKFRLGVQVFVLALFVAANCGFTAIVRHCTMNSPEKMMCCDSFGDGGRTSSATDRTNAGVTIAIMTSDCHTTALVGGLSTTPALVEKTIGLHSSALFSSASIQIEQNHSHNFDSRSSQLSYSSNAFAPPSVEKCVLNSSFLI